MYQTAIVTTGVALCLMMNLPAWAQQRNQPSDNSKTVEELIVTDKSKKENSIGNKIQLEGDELRIKVSTTLGETLSNELGIHNASFGPGVGLPVLRGLSGVRVRLVEDGIGSWDGSSMSADHSTTVEAVAAETVTVIKGPATLRHGGNAIGGVVAVNTKRMPLRLSLQSNQSSLDSNSSLDVEPVSLMLETRHEIINKHRQSSQAIQFDGTSNGEATQPMFGFHFDSFYRERQDLSIPGYAIDEAGVQTQFGESIDNNFRHTVANTDALAKGAALGSSAKLNEGFIGFSISRLENNYGIPLGAHREVPDAPGGGHNHGSNVTDLVPVRIDMEQDRYDVFASWRSNNQLIDSISFQTGFVDYGHAEEELGQVSTEYSSKAWETRLEVDHNAMFGFNGVFGIHNVEREFIAEGIEAFIPRTELSLYGLYLIEHRDFTHWSLNIGIRADEQVIEQREPTANFNGYRLMHTPIEHRFFNYMTSVEYRPNTFHSLRVSVNSSERAPDIQELLAFGQHLATRTFDIGALIRQQGLESETFSGIELGWEWASPMGGLQLQLFYTEANNYIYQLNTGSFYDREAGGIQGACTNPGECLPVMEYTQADAVFHGYEFSWRLPPMDFAKAQIEIFSDYVRGSFEEDVETLNVVVAIGDKQSIPRLPPLRFGMDVGFNKGLWQGNVRLTRALAQDNPGVNETTTDAYTRLDASTSYVFNNVAGGDLLLFFRGKNLSDEEIRNSTSYLRSFSPEPGRSVEVGIQYEY